jgi:hypothetical protein
MFPVADEADIDNEVLPPPLFGETVPIFDAAYDSVCKLSRIPLPEEGVIVAVTVLAPEGGAFNHQTSSHEAFEPYVLDFSEYSRVIAVPPYVTEEVTVAEKPAE